MKRRLRTIAFSTLAAGIGCVLAAGWGLTRPALAESEASLRQHPTIDFVRDVQPIFRENCYKCHGPDKQKAQLRLDSKDSVLAGGQSGKTIQIGDSKDSRLIHRVLGLDGDDRMPLKSEPLSDKQIATLKAWIDQGAKWPDSASVANAKIDRHWAYVKPIRPELPAVKNAAWCRNPIDYFVLAKLEKEGMQPSPEADRATLIRRVSLDLVGLPPTPKEVEDFVYDNSPKAYENLVDRLLASPHYGERQAIRWLDLARYADSNGYEKDRIRSMWPYRDWVINAFNSDMPFDQFTIEQIAGDLLPHPTLDQRIATGFNRNTMLNEEGGVDEHEYYFYTCIDRVDTTATVWLGSTLRCAQCHNHKYDPFTQKDFYRFCAYFNSTDDETAKQGGTDPHDVSQKLQVPPPPVVLALRKQVSELEATLDKQTPELSTSEERWEKKQQEQRWSVLNVIEARSAGGALLQKQDDGSLLAEGPSPATDTYTLVATMPLKKITAIRLEAIPDDRLPGRGPGRAPEGNFVLTHIGVSASPIDGSGQDEAVELKNASADFSQDHYAVRQAITSHVDEKTGWAIAPRVGARHTAVFETVKDIASEDGAKLTITLSQLDATAKHHTLGRFRVSVTDQPRPVKASQLPDGVAAALAVSRDLRTAAQQDELLRYYRTIAPELQPIRTKIEALKKEIAAIPTTTLVMVELPKPRKSYMHVRGAFLSLGEPVTPGVPAIFRSMQTRARSLADADPSASTSAQPEREQNRLDLARWLVSDDNPLTARVTVNRIWEQYFGIGIVATSEDFGTQGEPPSNQPLLDWLACEFMKPQAGGKAWDMKAIHKLIVMSATYRQSSNVTPEQIEKDPYNRMLARGPRFRLPAELIRDQALAVSGLLCEKLDGPSVFPPQPDGVWHLPYSGDHWVNSTGEDRYRRGVYTFYRRSAPYPMFIAFDKTTHETICTRRSRTDTPLQALAALNDPAFMETAAALARRIVKEGGDTPRSRVDFAFRDVLCRAPDSTELARLTKLYEEMLKTYQADPQAALKVATSDLAPPGKDLSTPELAAWTMVSNVLLNLDETLTKE